MRTDRRVSPRASQEIKGEHRHESDKSHKAPAFALDPRRDGLHARPQPALDPVRCHIAGEEKRHCCSRGGSRQTQERPGDRVKECPTGQCEDRSRNTQRRGQAIDAHKDERPPTPSPSTQAAIAAGVTVSRAHQASPIPPASSTTRLIRSTRGLMPRPSLQVCCARTSVRGAVSPVAKGQEQELAERERGAVVAQADVHAHLAERRLGR